MHIFFILYSFFFIFLVKVVKIKYSSSLSLFDWIKNIFKIFFIGSNWEFGITPWISCSGNHLCKIFQWWIIFYNWWQRWLGFCILAYWVSIYLPYIYILTYKILMKLIYRMADFVLWQFLLKCGILYGEINM